MEGDDVSCNNRKLPTPKKQYTVNYKNNNTNKDNNISKKDSKGMNLNTSKNNDYQETPQISAMEEDLKIEKNDKDEHLVLNKIMEKNKPKNQKLKNDLMQSSETKINLNSVENVVKQDSIELDNPNKTKNKENVEEDEEIEGDEKFGEMF